MKLLSSSWLLLYFLVRTGSARTCDWVERNQTVVLASVAHMERVPAGDGPSGCQAACCGRPDCDVAWVGPPAPRGPPAPPGAPGAPAAQCVLVRCRSGCTFEPSDRSTVFELRREEAPPTLGPRVEPLVGGSEPDQEDRGKTGTPPPPPGSAGAAHFRFGDPDSQEVSQ